MPESGRREEETKGNGDEVEEYEVDDLEDRIKSSPGSRLNLISKDFGFQPTRKIFIKDLCRGMIINPENRNRKCNCGVKAALKISESKDNPGVLYFVCPYNNKDNRGCGFFEWWMAPYMQRQWLKMPREERDGNCNIMDLLGELKEMVSKCKKESKEIVVEIRDLREKFHYCIVIMVVLGFLLMSQLFKY